MPQPAQTRRAFLKSLALKGPALAESASDATVDAALGPATSARVIQGMRMIALGPDNRHPAGLTFTPDQRGALVACQDTNSLAVIDSRKHRLEDTIVLETGDVPWDVATTADGKRAFVTNTGWDETTFTFKSSPGPVSVVDLGSRKELDAVEVGVCPNGITFHAETNRVFTADFGSNTVSVIDSRALKRVRQIQVGDGPYAIGTGPTGKYVAAVNFKSASLSVIDPVGLKVLRSVKVGETGLTEPHPEHGPGDSVSLYFADDSHVWIPNFRTSSVAYVDLDAGKVLKRVALPKSAPVVACPLTDTYTLVTGYGIFGIMDARDGLFVQRFSPQAPAYADEFVTSTITEKSGGAPEATIVSIASALLVALTKVEYVDPGPWAPSRTHELWATDAVTHSVGIIPLRALASSDDVTAEDARTQTTVLQGDVKPRLLDVDEIATVLGVTAPQVAKLSEESLLPGFAFGTAWYASTQDLTRWLDARLSKGEGAALERILS